MDIQKVINYWLQGAEKDWLACKHLYESKDLPQALFWGHLVLEKIIKAHVVRATNQQAPYSQDLAFLGSKIDIQLSQEQKDSLNEINTFNQFGRYDSEIMGFVKKCTPEYAQKYFLIINNLYLWLTENFHKKN